MSSESLSRQARVADPKPLLAALIVIAVYLAGAVPLIAARYEHGRGYIDENRFHVVAIRQFARQWPHPDLRDYRSATTPGYHLVLAAVDRYLGDDIRLLRLFGTLFTVGLLATIAMQVARRTRLSVAVALTLPLACSLYVFSSGVWLLPDNASWWGVAVMLVLALRPPQRTRDYTITGLVLIALVLARQTQIWTAALVCLSALIGSGDGDSDPERKRRVIKMGLSVLPAFIVLCFFVLLWHGVVPPLFGNHERLPGQPRVNAGLSPAAPALALALMGLLSIFYLGFVATPLTAAIRRRRTAKKIIAAAAATGLLIGILPPTSYDLAAGRFSGLWSIAQHLPVVANRSVLIVGLSALGGAMVAIWWLVLGQRDRIIFLAAFTLFAFTQMVNAAAWQRYFEPFILMLLALMASRIPRVAPEVSAPQSDLKAAWGPAVLALLLAAVTIVSLR